MATRCPSGSPIVGQEPEPPEEPLKLLDELDALLSERESVR